MTPTMYIKRLLTIWIFLFVQYNLFGQTFIVKAWQNGKIVDKVFPDDFRPGGLNFTDDFPDFEYYDINGDNIKLSDLKDKLIVINFWFVGCVGCKQEEPYLRKLTEIFRDNSEISFISFCNSQPERARRYIKKFGFFGYKVIPFKSRRTILEKFKVKTYATHMIVKNGKIVETFSFPLTTEDELNWYVDRIKKEL